jgi:hypothetical protein
MRKIAWLVGLIGTLGSAGCRQVECGAGTIEVDGVCEQGMVIPPGECAQGFFYDTLSGQCLSNAFNDGGTGVCGENTELRYNDAGIPFCVGVGGAITCDQVPLCPNPTVASKMSVCGRIFDIEDTTAADDDPMTGVPGISDVIEVLLYEPIDFATSPPGTAIPLPNAANPYPVMVDKCGYFSVTDVSDPGSGFLAIAFDDPSDSSADDYVLTGVAFPIPNPGQYHINGWITRRTTMDLWNTTAGGGMDFEFEGIFVPIFLDASAPHLEPFEVGAPAAGLSIQRSGMTVPADTWYFADTDQFTRRMVVPATTQPATGANGTGFMLNSSLVMHGASGEPAGCNVTEALAASIPNVVFVSERPMECM